MKRVGCLYRVSTKRQVYNNDIPLQRTSCRKFIDEKEDWILEKEYFERGISGYKVATASRDALKEIKSDVLNKKIDILLVFMFDRIGRQEDETPFVIEWLIEKGIEVWSVNEGQKKIEDRNDKLANYLTFWAAEGESEKIGTRSFEKKIQLTKEGIYLGSIPPYGYELIESEELFTKLGKKRKILKIYDKEANIVKEIFDLMYYENYGIRRIAKHLNRKGILKRNGRKWDESNVSMLVRNPVYKGYVSFGKGNRKKNRTSRMNRRKDWILADKPNKDIIIIDEKIYDAVNQMMDERTPCNSLDNIRLLAGVAKCGYCKGKLVPRGRNRILKCRNREIFEECTYTALYREKEIEKIIIDFVNNYLATLNKMDFSKKIEDKKKNEDKDLERVEFIQNKVKINEQKIQEFKTNIIKSILSNDTEQQKYINDSIKEKQNENLNLQEELKKIKLKSDSIQIKEKKIKKEIPIWKKEFNSSNIEIKKEILLKFVENIYLYNDNRISINLKFPIEEQVIKEV